MIIYNVCLALLLNGCQSASNENWLTSINEIIATNNENNIINPKGDNIEERISVPKGFVRQKAAINSKAYFFRHLLLKPAGSKVLLYNGHEKGNQEAHIAVLKMDIGNTDLQQCADAVMRLHSEYLFSQNKIKDIHFKFTNGFNADYATWKNGQKIVVKGNHCSWISSSTASTSYESFRKYLETVFNYAGSLSLSKEMKAIPNLNDMQIGDVFIRGGSPGHAVTVMDIALDEKGKKIFLLSQGYMPAQDIQILKNPTNDNLSPWYAVDDIDEKLFTPEYTFEKSELMRF